ncbi:Ketosteroid isomerase [Pedobacter cryoconitis]|uniref:Ketosteroid isomerase n=2 Tax=Pedobacter cryoconitis TaxID=188932 RepID=A0A127VDZ4_9SPHI|nr:Ketosteroid isomerase [Pedobacter cryoconitis]
MRNWDDEIRTIELYSSNAGKLIDNGERLAIKLYGSTPDSSITEPVHIQKQTKMKNATILHKANEFVKKGNYESFLVYCTQDTKWFFVGERILEGRDKVREYMKEFYLEPPVFTVEKTIEDGNYVTVTGEITLKAANGTYNHYDYCDIWRFENGKIAELKAFVIEKKS